MATHRTNVTIFYSCSGKCCYGSSVNTVVSVYLTATHDGLRQSPHFWCKSFFSLQAHCHTTQHQYGRFLILASEKNWYIEGSVYWDISPVILSDKCPCLFVHTSLCHDHALLHSARCDFFQFMIGSFCIFAPCAVSCNDETVLTQLTQPFASTACKMQ